MYETIETIDAYLNSRHTSGETDSLDREKPFFNIVTSAVNIWYRATDLDRRNIRVKASKESDYVSALLATVHLQMWMKKNRFGAFLNQWGRALARYGSAVVKFVEKDGELIPSVVRWQDIIVDAVDFDNNMKVEKLYYTPAQLKKNKAYDQEVVEALMSAKEARENQDGQKKDNKNDYIEVYEVHGELPLSLLTDKEDDEETLRQQMHVVSFVKGKDNKFQDFTLYAGKEKKDPYMITHLIEESGRTLSIGAVEYLFDAQWMTNHSVKAMKDQLDLASKLIFQTADANFIGTNVLTAIETGDILIHDGSELTQVNNGSHDIASLQSFSNQWRVLSQDITSTPDAIRGNTLPSGTAYRQAAILNSESHSLFEIMTENKGQHLEDMLRVHVIPHLLTKMDTTEEIAATLDEQGIQEIDAKYVPAKAVKNYNNRVIEQVLEGSIPEPFDQMQEENAVKESLATTGNQRFFKPSEIPTKKWKEAFADLVWDLDVEITNENTDKEATIATLSTVLSSIAQNPMLLQDPNARMILGKILEETGRLSPLQLGSVRNTPQQPQQQPPQQGANANPLQELTNNQNG